MRESDEELLNIFDKYADAHPGFDKSFGDSLREALYEYYELTEGQRTALENIISRFRMKKEKKQSPQQEVPF